VLWKTRTINALTDKWVLGIYLEQFSKLNRSSSIVCSENIDNWASERFTPLVIIETGNAGRLDKACLGVLSPGGA